MKRIFMFVLIIISSAMCCAQKINLLTDPSEDMGPIINYMQTVNGEKHMLTLVKDIHFYRSEFRYLPSYSLYDSLICNSSGLVSEEYTSPIYTEYGQKKVYQYNEKGLRTNVEILSWEKGEWQLEKKGSYEYNSSNKLSLFLLESVDDSANWTPEYKFVYAYDNNGRVSQIHRFESNSVNDSLSLETERFLYSYNSGGFITNYSYQCFKETNQASYVRYTMNYDEHNKIIDSVYYTEYNSSNKNTDSTKYYRNADGSVRRTIHYYSHPLKDSIEYYYNKAGILDSILTIGTNEGSTSPYYIYLHKYSYDNSGKISYIDQQMTFGYGSSSTERRRFNYDANGYFTGWYWCYLDSILQERASYSKAVFTNNNLGIRTKIEYLILRSYDSSWTSETDGKLTIPLPEVNDPFYYFNIAEFGYTAVPDIAVKDDGSVNPEEFALSQNYPNPFNPETKISFSLPRSGKTSLKIYDMLGREVAELVNGEMEKGPHSVSFNGRNLSSGIYIYRLQSGNFTESKKMMLIK